MREQRVASPIPSVHVFVAPPADPRLPPGVGSGFDAPNARRAARGERAERFSQLFRRGDPLVRSTLRRLGERAIHPNLCQLFSARQFRERRRWNARRAPGCYVPRPFDARRAADWSVVRSLTHDAERFVLTGLLYYHATCAGADTCVAESTGAACAGSYEDAIVRGFLEVVERDAVALWWYHTARRPALNLSALGDESIDRFRLELLAIGCALELLDLTSDVGVPVYAAVVRPLFRRGRVAVGFGAHFDPMTAWRRAVAESAQSLAFGRSVADAVFLHAVGVTPVPPTESIRSAPLDRCIDLTRRLGYELLVADLTRPDVGQSVVKVMVPELRPAWPRFAPGRLFEVPRRQGIRTSERLLNPVPFVF